MFRFESIHKSTAAGAVVPAGGLLSRRPILVGDFHSGPWQQCSGRFKAQEVH